MGNGIQAALAALAAGGMIVVLDDEDRENEADLVMAAQYATPERVAFFLQYSSGLLCTSITEERSRTLGLDLMVQNNTESHHTAFLVSVDYRHGTSTGISAHDRSATIRAMADPSVSSADFARPGHILPLRARLGGVLKRAGHTEAGVDLCRMAGLEPAALICEIVTPDRLDMMRGPEARRFAREHGLPVVTIASLIRHRRLEDRLVERVSDADIPTAGGTFRAIAYRSLLDGVEHLALVMGDVTGDDVLVRVHSECLTGDVIGSLRCDCGPQLQLAMDRICEAGRGVVVYLRGHEGRGIGLAHKLRAYRLQQDEGLDTVDANTQLGLPVDTREYGIGAQILSDLGVRRVRLLTNNPTKYSGLAGHGLQIFERVPLETTPTTENVAYLRAKRERMGHVLHLDAAATGTAAT